MTPEDVTLLWSHIEDFKVILYVAIAALFGLIGLIGLLIFFAAMKS